MNRLNPSYLKYLKNRMIQNYPMYLSYQNCLSYQMFLRSLMFLRNQMYRLMRHFLECLQYHHYLLLGLYFQILDLRDLLI